MKTFTAKLLLPVLIGALMGTAAEAGQPTTEQLLQRIEQLEARLGKMDEELAAEKQKSVAMEEALASDKLSESEPELAVRLKDVEGRTLSLQKQGRMIDALDGITASLDALAVGQSINADASASGDDETELNYRADVAVTLPGGEIGRSQGSIFAHVRLGQGEGVNAHLGNSFSAPNASAFDKDDGVLMLAQLWYQLDVPVGEINGSGESRQHMEINVGKMDPFLFFDQNSAADDESAHFMNSAFVHNPMLDAGGDIGVDDYGFTPGMRLAYHNEEGAPEWWKLSVAVTGAGDGASFDGSFSDPFVIAQMESGVKLFGGLDGNYRAYIWNNGSASQFNDGLLDESHSGWGLSFDQRIGDSVTAFARWGQSIDGTYKFDQALTLGAEFGGLYWDRSGDGIGLAWGWLNASNEYAAANPGMSSAEQPVELYYRWQIGPQVALSPDLQWVKSPGGDSHADDEFFFGLRALASF